MYKHIWDTSILFNNLSSSHATGPYSIPLGLTDWRLYYFILILKTGGSFFLESPSRIIKPAFEILPMAVPILQMNIE